MCSPHPHGVTKGLVTSDDVGREDVRVPGGVSVNHDQDWVSHNQDPSLSSSEAIVRLDDTNRGSGCQCGEHECHEECQCLRVQRVLRSLRWMKE